MEQYHCTAPENKTFNINGKLQTVRCLIDYPCSQSNDETEKPDVMGKCSWNANLKRGMCEATHYLGSDGAWHGIEQMTKPGIPVMSDASSQVTEPVDRFSFGANFPNDISLPLDSQIRPVPDWHLDGPSVSGVVSPRDTIRDLIDLPGPNVVERYMPDLSHSNALPMQTNTQLESSILQGTNQGVVTNPSVQARNNNTASFENSSTFNQVSVDSQKKTPSWWESISNGLQSIREYTQDLFRPRTCYGRLNDQC